LFVSIRPQERDDSLGKPAIVKASPQFLIPAPFQKNQIKNYEKEKPQTIRFGCIGVLHVADPKG